MDRIRALELENQRLKILEDENRKAAAMGMAGKPAP